MRPASRSLEFLAAADRAEAEEILEQLRRGSAEEMPDTAEMAEIRAKLAELGVEIAALEQELARAAPSEKGALESRLQERRNRLETGILFLIRLDISRRRGPAKPVGDFVPRRAVGGSASRTSCSAGARSRP